MYAPFIRLSRVTPFWKSADLMRRMEMHMNEKKNLWRLAYHLMPPDGWLNDPNGLCQADGEYHVYFQYAPNQPDPDGKKARTWGHYAGADLLNLSFRGVPFWPEEADRDGCYSGCAVVRDGSIELFYTGNIKHSGEYDYIHDGRESNTIYVKTTDGGKTYSRKEVLFGTKDYPDECTRHVRDPKVWKENGIWYMVLGARLQDDSGAVLFYESDDLRHWTFLKMVSTQKPFGYMWECPDYFTLDGQAVLSLCPQGLEAEEFRYQNLYQSGYFLVSGELREAQSFRPFAEWDYGFDFYAPQTFEDERGRRILIGWSGMPDHPYDNPTAEFGWENALTLPRVLELKDGVITQNPVPELRELRRNKRETAPQDSVFLRGGSGEIEIHFPGSRFIETASWKIEIGEGVCLSYFNQTLVLNMSEQVGRGRTERKVRVAEVRDARLFIDRSMLEFYFNGGEIVSTSHYFPDFDEEMGLEVRFDCVGAKITVWDLEALQENKQYL
jgi:beta-fructofuranosidase